MAKTARMRLLSNGTPDTENGTVTKRPPVRVTNRSLRTREYLTPEEAGKLIEAARQRSGRYGHRDGALILVAYRHGLRVSEIVALRWEQVDFTGAVLHVTRAKKGTPATHPLYGPELRALRRLQREQLPASPYCFTTERGGAPMTTDGVRKLVARIGAVAGLGFPVHPHMLRHGCGYKLANEGRDTRAIQQYLGHRSITHTVRYTELAPGRFKGFWQD